MGKRVTVIGIVNYLLILIYLFISMLGSKDIRFMVFMKKYFVLACAFNIAMFLILKIVDEMSDKRVEDESEKELGNSIDVKLEENDEEVRNILSDSLKSQNYEGLENSFDEISLEDINKIN